MTNPRICFLRIQSPTSCPRGFPTLCLSRLTYPRVVSILCSVLITVRLYHNQVSVFVQPSNTASCILRSSPIRYVCDAFLLFVRRMEKKAPVILFPTVEPPVSSTLKL
ncbi:hypothetical protein GQ43DRAFT_311680 [Delitschia confertaspora ATCC 74209]|uniref:Uncharacterized protein n=1 Tax=Delitschia confertaspora ATCC 74209 TaxID=1513339 RepID=A0A9P4JN38_9PLEO|nr:hypothetical protein GQ43DRAFT_311680 [Delitschia confertaspora ATCC 74209]